jgi:hypothetical protein
MRLCHAICLLILLIYIITHLIVTSVPQQSQMLCLWTLRGILCLSLKSALIRRFLSLAVFQAGGDVVSAALTQKFDTSDPLPSVEVTDRGTGLYEMNFTINQAGLLLGSPASTTIPLPIL